MTKRKSYNLLALVLVFMMVFISSTNVYAATGNKQFSSSGSMSITLKTNETGDSSTVTIPVTGLPTNAKITKLEVCVGTLSSYSGAMLTNYLTITSSNGRTEEIPWNGSSGKVLTTSAFLGSQANGTYTLSFNCTCLNGAIIGGTNSGFGTKKYSKPYIIVYWDDTL